MLLSWLHHRRARHPSYSQIMQIQWIYILYMCIKDTHLNTFLNFQSVIISDCIDFCVLKRCDNVTHTIVLIPESCSVLTFAWFFLKICGLVYHQSWSVNLRKWDASATCLLCAFTFEERFSVSCLAKLLQ